MTKLPRDVDGLKLAQRLIKLGYHSLRQKGSHITIKPPDHGPSLGIPNHRPLKTGMLHKFLSTAAGQLHVPIDELIRLLKL